MRVAFVITLSVAAAARGQTVVLSVAGLPEGPVANGQLVSGVVRVSWSDDEGLGYAGGAFRLRLSDSLQQLRAADILLPEESCTEHIGIRGASTVWNEGRRPATLDGETGDADGSFRHPVALVGGANELWYRAEARSGSVFLTGRNAGGIETQIEHSQPPLAFAAGGGSLFVSEASFDLFKFTVRAPLSGHGSVQISPEAARAVIYTTPDGRGRHHTTSDQRLFEGASFSYAPAPSALVALLLGGALMGRRRR
jgi:hypothetical protein